MCYINICNKSVNKHAVLWSPTVSAFGLQIKTIIGGNVMKGKLKQILSFLLVLLFVVSLLPSAFAEDELPEAGIGEPETLNPTSWRDEQEEPQKELPYGLAGMPEDYVMSDSTLADKQAQWDNNVAGILETMTPGKDYIDSEVLVNAESEEEAQTIAAAYNAELVSFNGHFAVLHLNTVTVREAVTAGMDMELALPPVDPNYIVTLDPVEFIDEPAPIGDDVEANWVPDKTDWSDWAWSDPLLTNPSGDYQYMHDMVHSYAGWGVTKGYSWVTVAVIDTGVDYNHEDLKNNYGTKIYKGYDYVDDDSDPMDLNGHGTHCAGIVAANLNNGVGGAGIAPSVSVLAVRVLNKNGSGSTADINDGIYYAADWGVQVISMSLGGKGYATTQQKAVNYAYNRNVTVIAAMGNDGTNVKCYPAALDHVIAVASVNQSGERAPYSNFGKWCEIAAPGSDIWSTVPGNSYDCWDGTSMATPVVAGAAALYLDHVNKKATPAQVEKALLAATNKCSSKDCGKGIIDVSKLLADDGSVVFDVWTCHWEYDEEYDESWLVWDDVIGSSDNLSNLKLSTNMLLSLSTYQWDDRAQIVYTVDGSTPSVADGQIKNGINGNVSYLNQFEVGDIVTLKALYVSGQGTVGKVTTWKLNIVGKSAEYVDKDNISVEVLYPKTLIPGKSVICSAKVVGEEGLNQGVRWIVTANSGCPSAKIDEKTGKLTTKAGETGTVTIRAISTAYSGKIKSVKIPVKQINPIGTITLSSTNITTYAWYYVPISVSSLLDNQKNSVSVSSRAYRWTSSNPKVAYVAYAENGECGLVTRGKGTATITCEVLDGSGKKATCKVSVLQQAFEISITGQANIASGTTATYKAEILPKTSAEKPYWYLSGAPSGVTIDSAKGVVKVPSTVKSGSFEVHATTAMGWADTAFPVKIVSAKASYVNIYSYVRDSSTSYPSVTKKDGKVTAVTLYSMNTNNDGNYENHITLKGKADTKADVIWTSSNPKVAAVDPSSGYVWAVSAGSATITCAAQDGSGKKGTCKVTVVNPVSQIFVKSKNPCFFEQDDIYLAGIGKTASNSVVFGTTYGTPTNKKVTWSFTVYQESWSNIGEYTSRTNITSQAVSNGWVKLSANGALTVNKSIQSKWQSTVNAGKFMVIYVNAKSQDGTNVTGTARYVVTPLTQKLTTTLSNNTVTMKVGNYTRYFYVYNDVGGYYGDYTITSSNPDIAAAVVDTHYLDGIYVYVVSGTKTGTAKITFKANDGSNKSVTVTVKVTK